MNIIKSWIDIMLAVIVVRILNYLKPSITHWQNERDGNGFHEVKIPHSSVNLTTLDLPGYSYELFRSPFANKRG